MSKAASSVYPEGTKMTTMTSGGRRKSHYTFPDESEMVEEYEVRAAASSVRVSSQLGRRLLRHGAATLEASRHRLILCMPFFLLRCRRTRSLCARDGAKASSGPSQSGATRCVCCEGRRRLPPWIADNAAAALHTFLHTLLLPFVLDRRASCARDD